MITCRKCNAQLEDGSKFCYMCGTEVTNVKLCMRCGTENSSEAGFCRNCGCPIQSPNPAPTQNQNPTPGPMQNQNQNPTPGPMQNQNPIPTPIPAPNPAPSPVSMPYPPQSPYPVPAPGAYQAPNNPHVGGPAKSHSKLPFIFIGAGALVLIALLAFMVPKALSIFTKTPQGVAYLKDDEINYSSLMKVKPKEITENLHESVSEDSYSYYNISFSEDGRRMFYPDQLSDSDESMTIYYCDVNKKKPEGHEIDSDITSYVINKKGTKVYYLKGEDGSLYLSNLKDNDKIDSDVSEYYPDETCDNIVYATNGGMIYKKEGSKDKELIDDNAVLKSVSADLQSVTYTKDGTLYIKSGSLDKEKVDSEVYDVIRSYDTGEIYYLKSTDISLKLSDFVNDDMAESDAAMIEPIEPTYPDYYAYQPSDPSPTEPSCWDYEDEWGYIDWDSYYAAYDEYTALADAYNQAWEDAYNAAVEQYDSDYDKYNEACDQYYAKTNRDSLRQSFEEDSVTVTTYSLYYYGSGKSTLITDAYNTWNDYSWDTPVLVYQNNIKGEYNRMNMSEVTSYDDVYNLASAATSFTTDMYVAVNSNAVKLEQKDGTSFYINEAGNRVYFIDNYDADNYTGDLSYVDIKDGVVSSPVLYDSEVYSYHLAGQEGIPAYFKNVENESGDLYIDKNKVDSDVYTYSAYSVADTDKFTYYTNYSDTDDTFTLKLYNGKESVKIGDDVYNYNMVDDKKIVYISDYDSENSVGDLYLYNGSGKNKLIDNEVTSIISVYH